MENNNEFLPTGYTAPVSGGGYMKLKAGENKIRILSKPILGYLDWKDKKPLRFKMDAKPSAPVDPTKAIKHFWAFVVYDYAEKKIQILEITQSSIQQAIQGLAQDADWGSPFGYDIKIIRTGEKMETTYQINPIPHKPVGEEIKKAYLDKPVKLEALFVGGDPFALPSATPATDALLNDSKAPF